MKLIEEKWEYLTQFSSMTSNVKLLEIKKIKN